MSARGDEFRTRIADLIQEYADVTGPTTCTIHDDTDDCDPTCTRTTQPGWYPRDWVIVTGWERIDPDAQDYWIASNPSKAAPIWAVSGLLATALNDLP